MRQAVAPCAEEAVVDDPSDWPCWGMASNTSRTRTTPGCSDRSTRSDTGTRAQRSPCTPSPPSLRQVFEAMPRPLRNRATVSTLSRLFVRILTGTVGVDPWPP